MTAIRVVLADDQSLLRLGFSMILQAQADIEVVGEADDGASAIRLCAELNPDVVLMDVRMPGTDGITATAAITAASRLTKVLILTTFDLDSYVYSGIRAGASGFLLKDVPPAELLSAIRVVAAGDSVIAPSATRRLLETFTSMIPDAERAAQRDRTFADLTARETEVVLKVAAGRSNREIAEDLYLSEGTVKVHIGRILTKLSLRDRVQLVVLAYEAGLVRPGANGGN